MAHHLAKFSENFWSDGYLYIPDFFSSDLMTNLHQRIIDHFGMDPAYVHSQEFIEQSGADVVPWFPEDTGESSFVQLAEDPDLQSLTQAILGDDWYSQYCMVMFSKKGSGGQSWHQDCLPNDPTKFNLNRLIYTMDIHSELTGGQVMVLPGSHNSGLIPSENDVFDESQAITLTPRKGSLVLLHGHCFHKVTAVAGDYRVSTNYRAAPKNTPTDITDIGVYRNMIYQFSTSTVVEQR